MGPQQLPMLTDQQGRAPASGVAALSQSRKALPRRSGIGLIDWTLPVPRFRQPMRRFDNSARLTQINQPTRAITWKGSSEHISKNFARQFRRWHWEQQVIRGATCAGDFRHPRQIHVFRWSGPASHAASWEEGGEAAAEEAKPRRGIAKPPTDRPTPCASSAYWAKAETACASDSKPTDCLLDLTSPNCRVR